MSNSNLAQESFIEDKNLRNKYLEKLEILEKVKELITLPNTELMTTKMVAEWYEVSQEVIRDNIRRNGEELAENGMVFKKYDEIKELVSRENSKLSSEIISHLKPYRQGTNVFSKRAALNLGMLLRDSQIAKRVRTALLDIEESASYEQKTNEIDREKELNMKVVFAESQEEMLIALRELREYKNKHIRQLEAQIKEQEPKVTYYDTILNSVGTMNITQIAKDYGLTAKRLNEILHEEKIQYKTNEQWVLYSQYDNTGYTESKTNYFKKKNGEQGSKMHSRWTQKGRLFIHSILANKGITPLTDK